MDSEALVAMLAAALALMGSPGPATLSMAATSAVFGIGRALPWFCGVCCGTSTIVILVASGVTGLVVAMPGAAQVLVILAGAYMVYLAYRIAMAPPLKARSDAGPPPRGIAGYLFAIANPKGYAAVGAVFASFVLVANDPTTDAVLKVVILVGMVIVVNVTWLLTGSALSRIFQSPRAGRVLNVSFALLLILSLVPLVL